MNQTKDMEWWYWLMTLCLLITGMVIGGWGFLLPIGFTIGHTLHYVAREQRALAFPVQVRIGYLLWMLLGLWEPFTLMLWIQVGGTMAFLTVGYCPMARMVSLMPWNRGQPLSFGLIWRTIVAPPVAGSIAEAMTATAK